MNENISNSKFSLKTIVLLLLPIMLLAGVIAVFLNTSAGLEFKAPVPIEDLTVERIVMQPGSIEIDLRNASPQALTIAQVVIFGFAFLALMGTIDNSNLFKET